jgi:hypothetical protein
MELAFLEKVSKFDTYGAELIVVKVNASESLIKNKKLGTKKIFKRFNL